VLSDPEEGRLIQLVYYLYVFLSRVALAVPERVAYALAILGGTVAARVSRKRSQLKRNLARVTGQPFDSPRLNRLVTEAYRSYARYWLETFRLVREPSEFFLERFTCHHVERLESVLERGMGAVVVVAHLGNWDAAAGWVGAWAKASGRSVVTIAEVLRPRKLFELFARYRARLGITILPARRGVTAQLVEAVREGKVVAILGDRDLKGDGPEVDFFGEKTTLPAGPALVALRGGVPLLVAGVYGVKLADGRRGWEAEISEPIELPPEGGDGVIGELTQQVAGKLEHAIAKRPEEWHVLQPLWVADR
jgi:lauroyl/myristoyl acyltransferase